MKLQLHVYTTPPQNLRAAPDLIRKDPDQVEWSPTAGEMEAEREEAETVIRCKNSKATETTEMKENPIRQPRRDLKENPNHPAIAHARWDNCWTTLAQSNDFHSALITMSKISVDGYSEQNPNQDP